MLDAALCYKAMEARDPRFDGRFYVGVSTTGIYCRVICTARLPRRERCSFFRTSAEAEKAGYRACLLCRPELAPGPSRIDAVPRLVTRAVALIEEGFLNERSIESLAGELGVTGRHLRRAMEDELGVSPVELAQSRRLALAKQLLHDTRLNLAELAFASGFRSVRRFNALFQARFRRAPTAIRRECGAGEAAESIRVRLDFRPPFDWVALLGFLRVRAIPGVESVGTNEYRRTVRLASDSGTVTVRPDPTRPALWADVSFALAGTLMKVVARLRALFDLDAEPAAIAASLGCDSLLAPLVTSRPGLRVPGAFDPFEATVRAVLGQQISVGAAATLAGRLARRFGTEFTPSDGSLTHTFPSAVELAKASVEDLAAIGLPHRRAESLQAVARAFASNSLTAERGIDPDEFRRRFVALPGIGDWTAQYVAMRALHEPDAFPASDLGIRKALGGISPRAALQRAEAWRPWRSYAVIHLWTSLSEGVVS